jgi:PAS domain S-box-containing protein
VIQVKSFSNHAYTENEVRIVEALASQLAAASSNAMLYQRAQQELKEKEKARAELKKRSKEQSILFETSKELSASLDIEEIYERIYKNVSRLIPCSGMGISSFDSRKKTIKYESIWAEGKKRNVEQIPEFKYAPAGKGMQSRVIKTRRSFLIEDFEEYSKIIKNYAHIDSDNRVRSKHKRGEILAKQSILSPLISENRVIGVIQVQTAEKSVYTRDHIRLLEALAAQASSAIMNARLYEQAQKEINEREKAQKALGRRTEELNILYEAQKKMSSTLELNTVYDNIYRIVADNMECDSMIISSYDRKDQMISVLAVWADGVKPAISEFPKMPLAPKGHGIQSRVIRSGESMLIDDYMKFYKTAVHKFTYTNDRITRTGRKLYSSGIIVPMHIGKEIIGTIQVLSYKKDSFTQSDLKFLEALTPAITAASLNARLYRQAQKELEEKEKAQKELAEKNEVITRLYEAGREISGSLNLDKIFDLLYKNVSAMMPCDSMIISRYHEQDNTVSCLAAWVENTKHDISKFPPLSVAGSVKGTQGEAIKTRKSVIVNNFEEVIRDKGNKYYLDTDGNVINYETEKHKLDMDHEVVKSAMFIPMMLGKKVMGVINVLSYEKNAYTDYDLRMLESISAQVTVTAANAELYSRAKNEIRERKKKEKELKSIRKNMEEAQRLAHLGNWIYDKGSGNFYNSEEIYRILGLNPSAGGLGFDESMRFIHPEDREKSISTLKHAIKNRISYTNEDRVIRPNGEIRHVRVMGEPVFNLSGELTGMQGTMQDITDVKRINEELMRSLNEKEMMLKEIHHRVKNNLQIVSSLLRLQSEKITDKTAVEYFKLSEQRVKSMALIHQQLYKTRDLSSINFREYLRELCTYLFFVNGVSVNRIRLVLDTQEVYYGIDIALPCGLIINELITNSLKHAFPGERKGVITVSLKRDSGGNNFLAVSDDGIGSPQTDLQKASSLGLELVNTLTEQLEGKLNVCSAGGTRTEITFKDQESK